MLSEKREKDIMKEYMRKRMEELGMNFSQVAAVSGLAVGHTKQIINGDTVKPGRDKLIRLCVGLYLDVFAINKILRAYDKKPLDELDISHFISILEKMKLYSGLNIMYTGKLTSHLAFCSIEQDARDIKAMLGYPPAQIWPNAIIYEISEPNFNEESLYDLVYTKIRNHILFKRRKILENYLDKFVVSHIMCQNCFLSHIQRAFSLLDEKGFWEYIGEILKCFMNKNYDLYLTDVCMRYNVELIKKENQKVTWLSGQYSNHISKRPPELITGLITDSKDFYKKFENEFFRMTEFSICDPRDKKQLKGKILKLIKTSGINFDSKKPLTYDIFSENS
jgi:transcriptional regulator with XRE-family HTH domain